MLGGTSPYLYTLLPSGVTNQIGVFCHLLAGAYPIEVEDKNNCKLDGKIDVPERNCCESVFIPNAFTPNNDGQNDELHILGLAGMELKDFRIYNRWGQLVFRTQQAWDSWNGHFKGGEAETDTYFYELSYRCLKDDYLYFRKGDILLIR